MAEAVAMGLKEELQEKRREARVRRRRERQPVEEKEEETCVIEMWDVCIVQAAATSI